MTQPYPPQFGQQAPAAPQQYAPPQGYPVQQPQGYPVAPPAGPQYAQQPQPYGYPQNQPGYGPPQQYGQAQYQQPPAPAAQMPANPASLDSFYEQPSSGWGPAWQLGVAVQTGTSYIGVVAQWVTTSHFEYATSKNQQGVEEVRKFRNGQPVVNMKVPLNVPVDQRFTEGRAQFYVGPAEKDQLNAAIAAAGGNPVEPPPLGSMIRATKTGQRGNQNGGQSSIKSIEYWAPEQAQQFAAQLGIPYPDLNTPKPVQAKHAAPEAAAPAPAPAPVAPAPAVLAGPAVQQQAAMPQPPVQPQAPQMPPAPAGPPAQYGPPQGMPPAPAAAPAAGLPPAPAAPVGGPIPGMSPDKAELMARLTGQAPPPAAA